jgi:membrane peptidoglycan carboxypeptidase
MLLQMHYAMSAIANGGKLPNPYYVQNIFDAKCVIVRSFLSHIILHVIDPEVAAVVGQILPQSPRAKHTTKGYN